MLLVDNDDVRLGSSMVLERTSRAACVESTPPNRFAEAGLTPPDDPALIPTARVWHPLVPTNSSTVWQEEHALTAFNGIVDKVDSDDCLATALGSGTRRAADPLQLLRQPLARMAL